MTYAIGLVALAVLMAVGLYVAFVHNRLIFIGFALVLAVAPASQVPLVQVSILFLGCLALWGAMATKPREWPRPSWVELLAGAVVVLSLFPLVAHGLTSTSISEYARWAAAVLVVVPLRALSGPELAAVARVFARGTVVAALVGLVLVAADPAGLVLSRLTAVGYTNSSSLAVADTSIGFAVRLVGPYGHPNIAALLLIAGLICSAVFLRGTGRILAVGVLGLAVTLTLSRAGMAGLLVAALVFVFAARGHARTRAVIGGGLALGALALMSVPAVRARVFDSFGPRDVGTSDRVEALESFPADMAGHWWLGRGFDAPEFIDSLEAALANFAANAVLHTMLRGGLVVGLALAALLVAAVVASWRHLRSGRLEGAALGAGMIGLVLLPIQLDVPLVTSIPVAASFSLLLAIVAHPDVLARAGPDPTEDDA